MTKTKRQCALTGEGKREIEKSKDWLTMTNAVQKSKRMRTEKRWRKSFGSFDGKVIVQL